MSILRKNKLMVYAENATNEGDVKNLNSIIDLGAKPLSAVIGPVNSGKIEDRPPTDPDTEAQQPKKKKRKEKPFSDLVFLPPRPNENLDVITYAECSP